MQQTLPSTVLTYPPFMISNVTFNFNPVVYDLNIRWVILADLAVFVYHIRIFLKVG